MSKRDFRQRVRKAVSDPNLKLALDRAAEAYAKARAVAFEGLDFERLRESLRAYKETSVQALPALFDRFKMEAEEVGVQVHQAADAEEANRIVIEIAAARGVRKVAKAKSMLTEEIELNHRLIEAGLQVTETDLGEWICQLAGERPSHFTAPAIHKTREEIAALFSSVCGEDVAADIPTLVEIARNHIRQAFLDADMGITGANIAIADTGTIVIVSNEGNARLVTSLPEVHVALIGYEKLVPSIDEATAIIKLLSKSGTGQKMTSYVSFITGPSRTSDIEKTLTLGCHGPREVHVVFVDNGRLSMADDPEFREALYCIKCGACLSACPVYHSVGGHVFGHTYVGGIGAILAAFHAGLDEAEDILGICSTCGRCKTYCPVDMDIPRMVAGLRRKLVEAHGQPWVQRLLLTGLLGKPERFSRVIKAAGTARKLLMPKSDGLPFPLAGLTRFRNLPAPTDSPLSERIPEVTEAKGKKRGTTAFYPGCVVEYVYPEIGEAVVSALSRFGWEVHLQKGQGCCGIPALLKGDAETARSLARHNCGMSAFQDADYVITACPTCLKALREDFVRLLPDEKVASRLADKAHDFSEFLINVAKVKAKDFSHQASKQKVTCHDPCHARHISDEPRKLLELAGYTIAEMANSDACCGFAGSYSISYPEISESILKRKLEDIIATGVSIVATDCPGCLLQLRGGLEKLCSRIRVAHTAELLAPPESS